MTQPVLPAPAATPGLCICGHPLPVRHPPLTPATTCSYWCSLVVQGRFTLGQIRPMLPDLRDLS